MAARECAQHAPRRMLVGDARERGTFLRARTSSGAESVSLEYLQTRREHERRSQTGAARLHTTDHAVLRWAHQNMSDSWVMTT